MRLNTLRPTLFASRRVLSFNTSIQRFRSQGMNLIDDVFHAIPTLHLSQTKVTKIKIVRQMVEGEYKKYLERQHDLAEKSNLFHLIASIPKSLTLDEKIELFSERLKRYPVMPVITAHPTRAISNEAQFLLYEIIELLAKIDKHTYHNTHKQNTLNLIKEKIQQLIDHSMVLKKNLVPEEESKMALYIYQRILRVFPRVYSDVVDRFVKIHGGNRKQIGMLLKDAIMENFRNVFSWVKGDGDGNPNVTAITMKQAIPAQQIALIELANKEIDGIIAMANDETAPFLVALEEKKKRFERCIRDIKGRVWFDVEGSDEEKQSTFRVIDELLNQLSEDSPMYKKVMRLRDLIELTGFYGGLKEFVRQTTTVHLSVWNNLTEILSKYHPEVQRLIQDDEGVIRCYDALTRDEQIELHNLMCTNTIYFETLHQHANEFTQQTKDELARLFLIRKNIDIFPSYIFSDTKDAIDFSRASLTMHFSAHHFEGALKMRQVKQYPFNALALCETPADLEKFGSILRDMLNSFHMRKRIAASGFLSAVLGPSDNSKVAGIMVYGLLLRTQMLGEAILEEYKAIYPELKGVQWIWMHGFGSDMKRQFGAPKFQRHCTHQGWGALDVLAAPGAYESFFHGLAGVPCASTFKIQEIRDLMQNHPETYAAWLHIEKHAMDFFQEFIGQSSVQELLAFMTILDLERKMNISSRAGSKKSPKPHEARAIGVVNHYMIGGDYWDIYMSIAGLVSLPPELKRHLPELFEHLTVCKDIVYKILFSIAVSDNSHLWERDATVSRAQTKSLAAQYVIGGQNNVYQTLAYMDINKFKVLDIITLFLPTSAQQNAQSFLKESALLDTPAHAVALGLMDVIGGDFAHLAKDTRERLPDFYQFRQCAEHYRDNLSCPDTAELAVLAGRGIQLPEAPSFIANLISPLHRKALQTPFPVEVNEEEYGCARNGCKR